MRPVKRTRFIEEIMPVAGALPSSPPASDKSDKAQVVATGKRTVRKRKEPNRAPYRRLKAKKRPRSAKSETFLADEVKKLPVSEGEKPRTIGGEVLYPSLQVRQKQPAQKYGPNKGAEFFREFQDQNDGIPDTDSWNG